MSQEGKLDEISFMLGEMSSDIKAIVKQNGEIEEHLKLINGRCLTHDGRLKKVEKKRVLGGTTRTEKLLIGIGSIGIALKFAWDAFFPG